ncbi:type I polyketide synthase [Sorangium sp. So ce1097]|uniref:type I polyketide synthase n=1 Tax=Sorangium sp. So ce1097 TaxID=3133330 RepID=UPI003F631D0A
MSDETRNQDHRSLLKRALVEIERLEGRLEAAERKSREPIAIVGVGCRLPAGGKDPQSFWRSLLNGVDGVAEIPPDRWDIGALYNPDPEAPGAMYAREAALIDGHDEFDAGFFGISPREAANMDPQQRLLLEVAWEALEDAGQTAERLEGSRTGVFVGVCSNDYAWLQLAGSAAMDLTYFGTGNANNILAGRLAYLLDARGPAMIVDTACSSSLMAVHLACQSLRQRECDLALAGGVNLVLSPLSIILACKMRVMSPDGRSRTFDQRANGMGRGEGCGVIALKRLADATADGDRILAVIRGSAANQDGRSNGLTAPNVLAQEAVIRAALQDAGVEASDISYVEAHGTATALGDPAEIEGLKLALGEPRPAGPSCALGSVKTNIGHLEAAAGIAALIKVVLSLQHRTVPPNVHFETLNPNISLDGTPFVIPTSAAPWTAADRPLTAGISSFGWSGTNVHVILQEAPRASAAAPSAVADRTPRPHVLPLSARSPAALAALATAYDGFLAGREGAGAALRDICYTASVRRSHHEHRLMVTSESFQSLRDQLRSFLRGESQRGLKSGHAPVGQRHGLAFVFPGHGSQWLGMGRELLDREPVFRASIEECERAFAPHVDWSLRGEIEASGEASHLDRIDIVQPMVFAIQVALSALWRSWGIVPNAVVGHSMGEVAAAYVAGALSLEDAARIICWRSRLLRRVSGQGAMALVELSRPQAEELLRGREHALFVAACNSGQSTVLSGDPAAIDGILAELQQKEVFCRRVNADVAFHSPQMDPLLSDLMEALSGIAPRPGQVPICSTVTGAFIEGQALSASYWKRNLREPVLFSAAVGMLVESAHLVFLEVSPHPVLTQSVADILREHRRQGAMLPSLRRNEGAQAVMLESLGGLYAAGYPVDFRKLYPEGGQLVSLPSYPWQHKRYWFEPGEAAPAASASPAARRAIPGRDESSAAAPADGKQGEGNLVAEIYDALVSAGSSGVDKSEDHADYLSWGIFPEIVPGFSWLRAIFFPSEVPEHVEILRRAQREVRRCLFRGVDLSAIQSVLDFGCGHASDLCQLGQEHAHLLLDGYTISPKQAELAARKIRKAGLEERMRVFNRDSAHDEFPASYDLVFGIEVAGLVADKESLFANIGRHLNQGGILLLADFVANTVSPIAVHDTSTFSSTKEQWIKLLADNRLQVIEAVDISQEAANCLHDPEHERELARIHRELPMDHGVYRSFESHKNVYKALRTGLISYVLFHVQKDRFSRSEETVRLNRERLTHLVPYSELVRREGGELAAPSAVERLLYEIRWEPSPAAPSAACANLPAAAKRWLLFTDGTGVGQALKAHLEARGETCVLVSVSTRARFQRVAPGHYELRPGEQMPASFFSEEGPSWAGVVHLWSLDASPSSAASLDSLQHVERLSCGSAICLVQALAAAGLRDPPRLWLVTAGAQAVQAAGAPVNEVAIAQAPLWGLGATMVHEHPELRCTRVDLDAGAEPRDSAAALCQALTAADDEDQIALRRGARYVARLTRISSPRAAGAPPATLHAEATYLITGGFSGIGLEMARWMVDQGARHLALLGRSGAGPAAQAVVEELRALGAEIAEIRADVGQREQLADVLAQIDRTMPPLRGIIHSAVALDDGVLLLQSPARLRSVMVAKMDGSWNLHELTRDRPLDFFVLFSSLASVLGSPGQGNYAAANAFVDALAYHRRALGLPAFTLNWAPWSEVGLAAVRADRGDRLAYRGFQSISPEQGREVMAWLLHHPSPQVAVMSFNLRQWRQFYPRSASLPLLAELAREQGKEGAALQDGVGSLKGKLDAAGSPERRIAILRSHILEQLGQVLRLSPSQIDADTPLRSLGFDSLMAVEVRNRLEISLGIPITTTVVWSYPTAAALTTHLAGKMGIALAPEAPPPEARAALAVDEVEQLAQGLLAELEQLP